MTAWNIDANYDYDVAVLRLRPNLGGYRPGDLAGWMKMAHTPKVSLAPPPLRNFCPARSIPVRHDSQPSAIPEAANITIGTAITGMIARGGKPASQTVAKPITRMAKPMIWITA